MRKTILFFILVLLVQQVTAQEECAFKLVEAQDMFNAGLIETIPDKLSGCFKNGFTNEEKLQAYKLVILSYLFDDNMVEADAAMLQFLNDYPSYEAVATDPREFVSLMETYDTDPVLMIGGCLGTSFSLPVVTERLGIYNYVDYKGDFAPGGLGFHGSFRVDKRIRKGLDISAGFSFFNNRFDYYLDTEPDITSFSGEITDFSRIEYYEVQSRISIPLSASYVFGEGAFTPYITVGINPGILLSASAEGKRVYVNTGDIRYDPVTVANVDVLSGRRIFNLWAFTGLGVKFSAGPGTIFLDARYYANLQNQIRPGSNRFIQELTWELFYVSDNFILNELAISVGYMFPIYHPKKKVE